MNFKKRLTKYRIIYGLLMSLNIIVMLIILTPWDPIIPNGKVSPNFAMIPIAYLIISCIWISFLENLQRCPEYHQYRVEVAINVIRFFGYSAPQTDIDHLIKPGIGNIALLRLVWNIIKTIKN